MSTKKCYIIGPAPMTKKSLVELSDKTNKANWRKQTLRRQRNEITRFAKPEDLIWTQLKDVLAANVILVENKTNDTDVGVELGAAWATNYILEVLRKNRKTETIAMLNKYNISKKKIIAISPKKTNKKIRRLASDHGCIVENLDEVIKVVNQK